MKITKRFKFELAHRLVDSYSKKCQSIHGHSYLAEITLEGPKLDKTGMLMDFGEVKDLFNWVPDSWDHSLMLWTEDPIFVRMAAISEEINSRFIAVNYNPTAENMAYHMFQMLQDQKLPVSQVRVQETLTGWAVAEDRGEVQLTASYFNIKEAKNEA